MSMVDFTRVLSNSYEPLKSHRPLGTVELAVEDAAGSPGYFYFRHFFPQCQVAIFLLFIDIDLSIFRAF
jgi:predicted component of type VI protein secretion system